MGQQPVMSATLGPPVKRDLKPKSPGFNTGSRGNGPSAGFHSLGRVGVPSGQHRTNRNRHRSHRLNTQPASSSNTQNHSDHEGSSSDHSESGIVANFPPAPNLHQ